MQFSKLTSVLFGTTTRIAITVSVSIIVLAAVAGSLLLSMPSTYEFPQHQKVSINSSLRLSFPELMDHASVEEHLSAPEDFRFLKTWEGELLVLKPELSLPPGGVISITVGAAALKANGMPLGKDMRFTFTVAGAPVLAAALPAPDSVSVPLDADIILVFDRPVVPLTQVQGDAALSKLKELPVTISPEVRGRWRWLGTTTASFHPEQGLVPATKYTVTVPPGIKTVSGDVTEKDLSWSFETERPRLLSSDPEEGSTSAGSTTRPRFVFNTPMDLISARDSISLYRVTREGKQTQIPITAVQYWTHEDADGNPITEKSVIVAVPAEPLSFSAEYVAAVKEGVRGLKGSLGSSSGYTVRFGTVGDFRVIRGRYDNGAIEIDFSSPVDSVKLSKIISFDPPVDLKDEVGETYQTTNCDRMGDCVPLKGSEYAHRLTSFFPALKPSTKYVMTLRPELQDRFGQRLKQPYTLEITTPKLDPEVFLYPRDKSFSIFEAKKPPLFYANNVNVSSMTFEFGKLSFESFLDIRLNKVKQGYPDQPVPDFASRVTEYQKKTVKPKTSLNLWTSTTVDLEKTFGALQPGLYALSVTAPEWEAKPYKPNVDQRYFVLTNMGLTVKYSGTRVLAWVTDLETGNPVQGATVRIRSLSGETPASGTTDKNGLFEAPLPLSTMKNADYDWMPEFWVTAEKGDDFAFTASDWNSGIQPYDFDGINADFRSPMSAPNRMLSVLYTERPLYGAGDTVYFKGIARVLDRDGKISVPETSRSIVVTVRDAVGTEVYSKTLPFTPYGSFSDSFPLSKDATLGQYSIDAKMIPDADMESYSWSSFSVLAYRKPEYRASVSLDKEEYVAGEKASVTVSGQYYFGAPMAGAAVTWRALSSNYYFNKFTDGWYSFALEDAWCWRNCGRSDSVVSDGKAVLDEAGLFKFSLPLNIDDKPVSQVFTVEADLTDKNNQVVSTRSYAVVHKSQVYVGIASDDYAVNAGEKSSVKLITLTPEGKAAPRTKVNVSLYFRTWNVVKSKGVDDEYYYESEPVDTFVRSTSVVTGDDGKATAELALPDGGEYRVVAMATDAGGHESKAGWSLYAFEDTYFNWPRSNNDRIQIVTDKPSYSVGDTAKLIVKSPFQGKGVKALVTIEREQVIEKRIVDVESNALPIEVQIKDGMIPVAYVSVIILKPRIGETFDENGIDTGAPAFKIGYARLSIDTAPKKIDLRIETDKEKYLPGDTVQVKLTAKNSSGEPVQTEVSLGVVDQSLVDLSGFSLPDIVSSFYYERGVGIQTASMFLNLMERFKPGSKGGDGSNAGESKARGNFKDTAYWNPTIVTGKDGTARVSFTLPDNLTTWQLLSIGSTKNHLFGAYAKTVIETKRVILRPVRPRFAVTGDTVTLGAIVHNFLDEDATFKISLKATGLAITGQTEHSVKVPKGANVKVSFPVTVLDGTGAVMRFRAETDGAVDEIVETIPVWPFGVLQTTATSGVTGDQVTESVVIPTSKDAPDGTLTVSASPSLAVYLTKGLEYLSSYPYGCAEQVVSRFVPNVALRQLQVAGVAVGAEKATLEKNVIAGLQTLYGYQNSDGGFGYFSGSPSYPYLTAYILDALRITKASGYSVDAGVIDRGLSYVKGAIAGRANISIDMPSRAYIHYVLSEFGMGDAAALNALMKHPEELPVFAKAYIALAYQKSGNGSKAESVLTDILAQVKVDARSAHFEEQDNRAFYSSMNSDTRTTAIVLKALARIQPDHPLVPKIIRGLLLNRHDGYWDSTQTTAQVILAFVEYLKKTDELGFAYNFGIDVGGEKILDGRFEAPAIARKEIVKTLDALKRGNAVPVSIGKEGKGKLYYDVLLQYFYTPDAVQPAEEGIGILRETKPLTKADASLRVGTTQKVTLTITVPETRHFVAVESMLPAGYEPIDLRYATSQQGLLTNAANSSDNFEQYWRNQAWRFTHTEFRDDRVFLFADELPPGVYKYEYLVRVTTPGTFRERPARAFEMYSPETFGQSAGGWLQIKE